MIKLFENYIRESGMIKKYLTFLNEGETYKDYNKLVDYTVMGTMLISTLKEHFDKHWDEDIMLKHLNDVFVGWLIIDGYEEFIFHVVRWDVINAFILDAAYYESRKYEYKDQSYNINFLNINPFNKIRKIEVKGIKEEYKIYNPNDPYCEEIWNENYEFINEEYVSKWKPSYRAVNSFEYKADIFTKDTKIKIKYLNYLNKFFTGLIIIEPNHPDYILRVINWHRGPYGELSAKYDGYICKTKDMYNSDVSSLKIMSFQHIYKMEQVIKRNITQQDPYGEEIDEDWI